MNNEKRTPLAYLTFAEKQEEGDDAVTDCLNEHWDGAADLLLGHIKKNAYLMVTQRDGSDRFQAWLDGLAASAGLADPDQFDAEEDWAALLESDFEASGFAEFEVTADHHDGWTVNALAYVAYTSHSDPETVIKRDWSIACDLLIGLARINLVRQLTSLAGYYGYLEWLDQFAVSRGVMTVTEEQDRAIEDNLGFSGFHLHLDAD